MASSCGRHRGQSTRTLTAVGCAIVQSSLMITFLPTHIQPESKSPESTKKPKDTLTTLLFNKPLPPSPLDDIASRLHLPKVNLQNLFQLHQSLVRFYYIRIHYIRRPRCSSPSCPLQSRDAGLAQIGPVEEISYNVLEPLDISICLIMHSRCRTNHDVCFWVETCPVSLDVFPHGTVYIPLIPFTLVHLDREF
jgi:hypothetical protein